MEAETRYAKSGDVNIAYQVVGDGPLDLVLVPGWVSHVEQAWEEPSFARVPPPAGVVRAADPPRPPRHRPLGSRRPAPGAGRAHGRRARGDGRRRLAARRALRHLRGRADVHAVRRDLSRSAPRHWCCTGPSRSNARGDDSPWGHRPRPFSTSLERIERRVGNRRSPREMFAPSLADDERSCARGRDSNAAPSARAALARCCGMAMGADVRHILPAIRVPTLILHASTITLMRVEGARYMAEHIPARSTSSCRGADHFAWVGDVEAILDEVEEFLTGARQGRELDRVLATMLFTDIVDSTARAAELGDARWRRAARAATMCSCAARSLASAATRSTPPATASSPPSTDRRARSAAPAPFATPSRGSGSRSAPACTPASARSSTAQLGGIAVHIGARVAAHAEPGEILASSTVRDLVVGSQLRFNDRGVHALKGLSGDFRLFLVEA